MRVFVRLTQAAVLAGLVTLGAAATATADAGTAAPTTSTTPKSIGTDWP